MNRNSHFLLAHLPSDLMRSVSRFLPANDLASLCLTSRKVYQHLCIGSVDHPPPPNRAQDWVDFNDRFGCGWGYAVKLQGVAADATFANRPIHSVRVSFSWRDQGWGNRKGGARVVAVSGNNHLEVCNTHSTGAAPHEAGQKTMSFLPIDGMEYYLQVWVGSGGGHSLHLKDIQLHYIIFDDMERSVTGIHRKLYGTLPPDISCLLRPCQDFLSELQSTTTNPTANEVDTYFRERFHLRGLLAYHGIEMTPASLKAVKEVLVAEADYRQQLIAMVWKVGINSSELHTSELAFGDDDSENDFDTDDEIDMLEWVDDDDY